MDSHKVEAFLMANGKFFPGTALPAIQKMLSEADDSQWIYLQGVSFRDPVMMLVISFIGGSLGIDRFLIGDTGLGIGKLLTCGGVGIWAIVDYFLIMNATKESNLKKLQTVSLFNGMQI
jgi:hypothetical protein